MNSSENKWEKTSKFNSYINGTRIELLWVFLVCVCLKPACQLFAKNESTCSVEDIEC